MIRLILASSAYQRAGPGLLRTEQRPNRTGRLSGRHSQEFIKGQQRQTNLRNQVKPLQC